jgi:hypothetical protein
MNGIPLRTMVSIVKLGESETMDFDSCFEFDGEFFGFDGEFFGFDGEFFGFDGEFFGFDGEFSTCM